MPLVTILTRTRGRPAFLARALDSVLAQTFSDWVHLVVNDGGDARQVDAVVARRSRAYGGRLQVFHLDPPRGRSGAANEALDRSASTLAVFHDDDDTWRADFLARAVAAWRASGRRGVVTRCERVVERLDGEALIELRREPFFADLEAVSLADLARGNCIVNNAFLFERAAARAVGPFDEALRVYEDWDFNLRFLQRFDVRVVPEVLAFYHHREGASGEARNSFAQDGDAAADARARLVNRHLRSADTQALGLLLALGPALEAIDGVRARVDKLFNLAHGVRRRWPLKQVESWLSGGER